MPIELKFNTRMKRYGKSRIFTSKNTFLVRIRIEYALVIFSAVPNSIRNQTSQCAYEERPAIQKSNAAPDTRPNQVQ